MAASAAAGSAPAAAVTWADVNELKDEANGLDAEKKELQAKLDELGIVHTTFYDVAPDPSLACAKEGAKAMTSFQPDCIIAIGGGSAMDAITIVKRSRPRSIKFLCIIAAPEGLKALSEAHPDVHIYCAAVDEKLNEHGYILPGLGDAGDRIFGTM